MSTRLFLLLARVSGPHITTTTAIRLIWESTTLPTSFIRQTKQTKQTRQTTQTKQASNTHTHKHSQTNVQQTARQKQQPCATKHNSSSSSNAILSSVAPLNLHRTHEDKEGRSTACSMWQRHQPQRTASRRAEAPWTLSPSLTQADP